MPDWPTLSPFVAASMSLLGDAVTGDAARERYLIRLQPVPRLVNAENWTDRENEIVAEHFRGLKKRLAGS